MSAATVAKPFVFVLMPFSDDFADPYEVAIKPACEAAGARCERVDEQIFVEHILERVYGQIAAADVVVAEMTGRNPNVFYEVGYAHALGKRVVLLTRDAADIPFDLHPFPHIVYAGGLALLKRELERKIRWLLANPAPPARRAAPGKDRRLFAHSDSAELGGHLEERMLAARRISLAGVGLNVLQRDVFAQKLLQRAAAGECDCEILLSDPESPAVEVRLIEEEQGTLKPPVARAGLRQRLETLLGQWRDLGRPDTLRLRLTTNYLTFALLVFDDDYFVYPYGYATLGNFSPVLHFSAGEPADAPMIEFLKAHHDRLAASSLDADTAFRVRGRKGARTERLRPFALYFVPPSDSDLYQFGSEILGWDVRRQQRLTAPWPELVGGADAFGFHLTICDALYFLEESEVRAAVAEVLFLAQDFRPFELAELRLEQGFPFPRALALRPRDASGTLEALHHELTLRVNRRAAASNYTLGLTRQGRDERDERTRLMLRRYRAPYVLQRFTPHFTLLADVPAERWPEVFPRAEELFAERVQERSLRVERLAVMERAEPEGPWMITAEVRLG